MMTRHVCSAAAGVLLGLAASASAATYNCLPLELRNETDHVRVLCAEPSRWEGGYPRDGADRIRFFAVAKTNADFAKRFVYVVQTALTAGLIVQFQYTSGDVSGTAFGCAANECRTPSSFGLLAPATDVRIPFAVWPSQATAPIAQGSWRHYGPFSISSYRKLVVSLTGTGNADLYVNRDDPPSDTKYTCRPQLSTSTETCNIPGPAATVEKAVTYYVAVKGVGASNTFKLSVSIQPK
jgi:hypothetical protein